MKEIHWDILVKGKEVAIMIDARENGKLHITMDGDTAIKMGHDIQLSGRRANGWDVVFSSWKG